MEMRNEVQKSAVCLLHNNDQQTNTVASFGPLHDSFGAHSRNVMEQMPILLKQRAKFCWDRQRYTDVKYVRQKGFHVLLPVFGCSLSAARAEPRFARMKNELRFCLRSINLGTESDGSTFDHFP